MDTDMKREAKDHHLEQLEIKEIPNDLQAYPDPDNGLSESDKEKGR